MKYIWVRASQAAVLAIWSAMLVVVLIGEALPSSTAPMRTLSALDINDKVLHFTAYALLALVPASRLRWVLVLFCLGTTEFMGVAVEYFQRTVPGRSFDLEDILANSVGLFTGGGAGLCIRRLLT